MKIIGITGGSGVGKTTVLGELEQFDTHIIDCDAVYHRLLESDAGLLGELRDRFGQTVFRDDGSLDRKALGGVVFRDANALADLNAITHKYVDAEVDGQIEAARRAGRKAVAVDAIALLEGGLRDKCDLTVAVTAPEEARVKRLMAREGISEVFARTRIAAQKPNDYFAQNCDYVFYNDGDDPDACRAKARALFQEILKEEL